MTLEDVFTLTGRGTVVTGKVLRGTVRLGDKIQVLGLNRETIEVEVDSIEAFRKNIEVGTPGIELGLLLKNINTFVVESLPDHVNKLSKEYVERIYL